MRERENLTKRDHERQREQRETGVDQISLSVGNPSSYSVPSSLSVSRSRTFLFSPLFLSASSSLLSHLHLMEPLLSPPAEHQPTFLSSNGHIDSSTESPPALPHAESYTPDEPPIPPVSEKESQLVSSTRRGKPRGYLVRAVLLTRLSAMVFSLFSFSLMAASQANYWHSRYWKYFDETMECR